MNFFKKVDVERFGYNNFLQAFDFMKRVVEIAMDIWWNSRWKESVYKMKEYTLMNLSFYTHFSFSGYLIKHPSMF